MIGRVLKDGCHEAQEVGAGHFDDVTTAAVGQPASSVGRRP